MNLLKRMLAVVMFAATLVATVAALPAGAATTSATAAQRYCPIQINQADNGKTVIVPQGSCARLTLDSGLVWSKPSVTGTSVVVTPVSSCPITTTACPLTPGVPESWDVVTQHGGNSIITSWGRPVCTPGAACPQFIVAFRVTIAVPFPP